MISQDQGLAFGPLIAMAVYSDILLKICTHSYGASAIKKKKTIDPRQPCTSKFDSPPPLVLCITYLPAEISYLKTIEEESRSAVETNQ